MAEEATDVSAGSLDPRAAAKAEELARSGKEAAYSPAAPSSTFDPHSDISSMKSTIKGQQWRRSVGNETSSGSGSGSGGNSAAATAGPAPGPGPAHTTWGGNAFRRSNLTTSTGDTRATHSRSASQSTTHREIETMRAGPKAQILDVETVAALLDRSGVAAPKRRGLGLLSRFRRGANKRGDRANGIRSSSEESNGMTETMAKAQSSLKGEKRRSSPTEPRSVKSGSSMKRKSVASLRLALGNDVSSTGKTASELMASGAPAVVVQYLDQENQPRASLANESGTWEDLGTGTSTAPGSPIKAKVSESSTSPRWPVIKGKAAAAASRHPHESDSSSWSPPSISVGNMTRADSTPSSRFGSSTEALGNVTTVYDHSATIKGTGSLAVATESTTPWTTPTSTIFDEPRAIMDRDAFDREKRRVTQYQAYLLALSGLPDTSSAPYEPQPPPRKSTRRRQRSTSTSESSTNLAPTTSRHEDKWSAQPSPSSPVDIGQREILASPDIKLTKSEEELIVNRRKPLPIPPAASDQLSSMGSDYKHRGPLMRSREASEVTDASVGIVSVLEPVPVHPAATHAVVSAGREPSEGTVHTTIATTQPPTGTAATPTPRGATADISAEAETTFESDSFRRNLLRSNPDRGSTSTFGNRHEAPPPFASPTFGTRPHHAESIQRRYREEARSSYRSSGHGHGNNSLSHSPRNTRPTSHSRLPLALRDSSSPNSKLSYGGRPRSKSDPSAHPNPSDQDTSGETQPDPVPYPERAVQASLAALHALEASDDLEQGWAFERLMGTASRKAAEQLAESRRRLDRMVQSTDAVGEEPPLPPAHSRARRRADPYQSSRNRRRASEEESSGREETYSIRSGNRNTGTRKHMLDASGMATISRRSLTASESESLLELYGTRRAGSSTRRRRAARQAQATNYNPNLRPRVPSDWRRSPAPVTQELVAAAGPTSIPVIDDVAAGAPTSAEWDETVAAPQLRRFQQQQQQASPSSNLRPSPNTYTAPPLPPMPRTVAPTAAAAAASPSMRADASLSHRSRKTSASRKRPTKQGYGKDDILAWQASLFVPRPASPVPALPTSSILMRERGDYLP